MKNKIIKNRLYILKIRLRIINMKYKIIENKLYCQKIRLKIINMKDKIDYIKK